MTGEREMGISFGGLVADYRRQAGLSQAELAAKAKISRNYVSLIERNLANDLSAKILVQIANALNVSPASLFHALPGV